MKSPAVVLGWLLLSLGGNAQAQDFCEPLQITSQTYDVNDSRSAVFINTIETNHFPSEVEHLRRGLTGPLPMDIAFVLRYIPNHYRALTSMAAWQLQHEVPLDIQN